MNQEVLGISDSGKELSDESPSVTLLTMGQVQKRVHNLSVTEWNSLVAGNPDFFGYMRADNGRRGVRCIADRDLQEFENLLKKLRKIKQKRRSESLAISPQIRSQEYLKRKIFRWEAGETT